MIFSDYLAAPLERAVRPQMLEAEIERTLKLFAEEEELGQESDGEVAFSAT